MKVSVSAFRYVDTWENEAQRDGSRDSRADPAVGEILGELGHPPPHSLVHTDEVEVADTCVG